MPKQGSAMIVPRRRSSPNFLSPVLKAINGRHSPVDRSQVVVQKLDVAARDLERRRAMAENPLQGEDVPAVGEEGPREAMAEDVG
jgi:hypothetical protein